MKKIIALILVFTLIVPTVNITFAETFSKENILEYNPDMFKNITKTFTFPEELESSVAGIEYVLPAQNESCVPGETSIVEDEMIAKELSAVSTGGEYTFNANMLTKFNTITGPIAGNGANEPKFSYNRFLEEKISDYSGELTLNFEDLVLEGRNGLDLKIGRTYQSVAANIGEKTLMILPDAQGNLYTDLVNNYSTYLLDRYSLGVGWSFSFPSVQIETEFIPQEVGSTYSYDEETELYYHSGNGEVYQVEFTSDTTDSNLKGYYNKDIQFNNNDTAFTNGQKDVDGENITSQYSLTLSDKTKQYFAKDGRLLGIVDRFGNTIKFEHELMSVASRVPEGNFRYDSGMWTSSMSGSSYDAVQLEGEGIGRNDNYVMYFRSNNTSGETYITSAPIQVKPSADYEFGISIKSTSGSDVRVEIIGYDTAYNYRWTKTLGIIDYPTDTWHDFSAEFTNSSAVRYVVIKISPQNANGMYVDNVRLDEPKPLISKITDSIGRTVSFAYTGDVSAIGTTGAVTITVSAPNGTFSTLTYNKESVDFSLEYADHTEQRTYWYLNNSHTEGNDGSPVYYEYAGGAVGFTADDKPIYPDLYLNYESKTYSTSDSSIMKPLLSAVEYKDRRKVYEYEIICKHLGDEGYYDTLRVKKKYDKYFYLPVGSEYGYYTGELGAVNYTYSGTYNGSSFNNETGYPNYTFDDETELGELWTVSKTGKTTDTATFSNCALIQQTSSSAGTVIASNYTNHETFKNSPVQIKNTVSQNGSARETYIIYSYNDWGGVTTESKEVDTSIKNNSALLEKYTTTYQYNPNFHVITQKSWYNNPDGERLYEKYTYDSSGRMTSSENASGEKMSYYYENSSYSFLLTKTVQKDPMRFHNLLGGDNVVTYTYDNYALYPAVITEIYDGGTAQTSYVYDYITGDVLQEKLPDESYTDYQYYSDGRVFAIVYPCEFAADGRVFYTLERHSYSDMVAFCNYDSNIQVGSADAVRHYQIFTDAQDTPILYGEENNFYDAVGNLKYKIKYDLSKTDSNENYLAYHTGYYYDSYDRLIKTADDEGNTVQYSYDGFDRPVNITTARIMYTPILTMLCKIRLTLP